MGKTLVDLMANALIREGAEDVMVKAANENDPVYLLARLVREQAKVAEAVGREGANLRLESRGLSLRDHFAIHAPPMPKDWRPRVKGDPKPEKPTLDYITLPDHRNMIWRSLELGQLASATYTDDPIGAEWERARREVLDWNTSMKTWNADSEAIRAARWPWHYADLCLSNRGGE